MLVKPGAIVDGKYTLLAELGAGSMGSVYKAQDLELGRIVALKFIDNARLYSGGGEAVERFLREARALALLSHPNIVGIHSIGYLNEHVPYLSMEYVEGESLRDCLARRGALPWAEALQVSVEILKGLVFAHSAGVIHRDVKPENILMAKHGAVKIVDFGICRIQSLDADKMLTGTSCLLGTATYMAPEIPKGGAVTSVVDVYSFGCVLYEMLTGQAVFSAESPAALISMHCNAAPPRLRDKFPEYPWPPELDTVVQKSLEKDPGSRPVADDVLAKLQKILLENTNKSLVPPSLENRQKTKMSLATVAWSSVLIVLFASVGLFFVRETSALQIEYLNLTLPLLSESLILAELKRSIELCAKERQPDAFARLASFVFSSSGTNISKTGKARLSYELFTKSAVFPDQRLRRKIAMECFSAQAGCAADYRQSAEKKRIPDELQLEMAEIMKFLRSQKLDRFESSLIQERCNAFVDLEKRSALLDLGFDFVSQYYLLYLACLENDRKGAAQSKVKVELDLLSGLAELNLTAGKPDVAESLYRRRLALSSQHSLFSERCDCMVELGNTLLVRQRFKDFLQIEKMLKERFADSACCWETLGSGIRFSGVLSRYYFQKARYKSLINLLLPRLRSLYRASSSEHQHDAFAHQCFFLSIALVRSGRPEEARIIAELFDKRFTPQQFGDLRAILSYELKTFPPPAQENLSVLGLTQLSCHNGKPLSSALLKPQRLSTSGNTTARELAHVNGASWHYAMARVLNDLCLLEMQKSNFSDALLLQLADSLKYEKEVATRTGAAEPVDPDIWLRLKKCMQARARESGNSFAFRQVSLMVDRQLESLDLSDSEILKTQRESFRSTLSRNGRKSSGSK